MAAKTINRLFQPVDIASLVLFRIVFGILGFADVLSTLIHYHWTVQAYDPDGFQFKYYGFEWVRPLPEPFMSLLLIFICLLGLLVAVGKWYRIVAPLFAFGFTYTFFLEKAHYLNHGYLFCWVCFVMALLPAHRQLSVDVYQNPTLKRDHVPYWCLFVLQFMMGVVYFYGGIAKINPDWLAAIPLKQWIGGRTDQPIVGPLLGYEAMAYFMAYGGLLLDLSAAFLLIFRRTRIWVFLAILFFHVMNLLVFAIGIFPFLSITLSALFFPPDFPRRWVHWLAKRSSVVRRWQAQWQTRTGSEGAVVPIWQTRLRQPILYTLGVAMAIHLLLPFRHHLFPGDVAWTEEGHRYSWRMMLRGKQGQGHFVVKDQITGQEEKVYPYKRLGKKQNRKLYSHPDMVLQFAHYIGSEYRDKGWQPEVYAHIRVRLNYRDYCTYIDPDVDLMQEEWSYFQPSDWIVPEVRKTTK